MEVVLRPYVNPVLLGVPSEASLAWLAGASAEEASDMGRPGDPIFYADNEDFYGQPFSCSMATEKQPNSILQPSHSTPSFGRSSIGHSGEQAHIGPASSLLCLRRPPSPCRTVLQ